MKRIIVDYNKLNDKILDLLVSKYPDGYDDRDIISFKNAAGDWIECVEVRTEDSVYLVKVSKRLESAMTQYEEVEGEGEGEEKENDLSNFDEMDDEPSTDNEYDLE